VSPTAEAATGSAAAGGTGARCDNGRRKPATVAGHGAGHGPDRTGRPGAAAAAGSAAGTAISDGKQHRGPMRPRRPVTAPGHGNGHEAGHGPNRTGGPSAAAAPGPGTVTGTVTGSGAGHGPGFRGALMAPQHRPAVAFDAGRAWAPARRPAVACGESLPRSVSATCGRLDGLLGDCGALLRTPFPGEPHTVLCPLELGRWRHNTVYCTPAGARPLVLCGAREGAYRWEARFGDLGTRSQSFRRLRFGRRHVATPSAMTGSATRVAENHPQRQRLRQQAAPGFDTDTDQSAAEHRPGPVP
jgi:hypothetical protein